MGFAILDESKREIKRFVWATGVRAMRTFAEGMLGVVGTTAIGITQVDWLGAASVGATSAVIAVLLAVVTGLPETFEPTEKTEKNRVERSNRHEQ